MQSPNGPNFEDITSMELAKAAAQQGRLARLYLFPLDFGGSEEDFNVVFVPPVFVELKERFDNLVVDLYEQGLVTGYSASPEYKGDSFVPAAIVMEAKGKGGITERMVIW